jgi:D-alanyl-D-alanine carboxypeptidase
VGIAPITDAASRTTASHSRGKRPRARLAFTAALTSSVALCCTSTQAPPEASASAAAASAEAAANAPRLDDTPAARRLTAWLAAFNSGDPAQLRAYEEQNVANGRASMDATFIDRELVSQVGSTGFVPRKIESSTPTRIVAILGDGNSEQFVRAIVEVDPVEPHRVIWLQANPMGTPDELRPARMSEADAISALRAEIAAQVAIDRFSGAVLVAKNGAPILSEAYGLADRERRIPNQLDTRFRVASMNKMFTATAVLQLVQAGKLHLSDTLGKILPEYPQTRLASAVTVHHLLTHTGGTGDIFGPEYAAKRLELRTIKDYVDLYPHRELRFPPGSRWEYSNFGFVLLGAVIEKVTGQSYYDWVRAHVFEPAGMTSTAWTPEDQLSAARSIPYTRESASSPWRSAADTLPHRASSAGGGDSTVADLLRFANALTSHKLLDAEHTAMLTTRKADDNQYAYGFNDRRTRGVRCVGHGGASGGMNGQLDICDSGYTVVVLANLDPPAAFRIASFILDRLPAK